MSCPASTKLASAVASGYGTLGEIQLLQVVAQLTADYAQKINPALDVSASSVIARANTNQYTTLPEKTLLMVIAQNLCTISGG